MSVQQPLPTVKIPTTAGYASHAGWVVPKDQRVLHDVPGWVCRVPDAGCRECGTTRPLQVAGVRIVGGVHSLIWRMDCGECGAAVEYPATDYSGPEDPQ